jgi:NADPH2:quinone reductase
MKAVRIEAYGGAEQLRLHDVPSPAPGPGEVVVRIAAAGINFMDIGVVNGMYWRDRPLPLTPGVEGAGRVTAAGGSVDGINVGDRVTWFYAPGSYAEEVLIQADALVPVPPSIDDETAASAMMQGLTANHFTTETYAIKPGDTALVHSAAGGVGLMLTQMIKLRGGTVIGRVSNERKAEIARKAGADHVIIESGGAFADEVRRLTNGEGVQVVYDGAGADTFQSSLASLAYHGVLAYYGQTIKRLPPIDLLDLPRSIHVTYPRVQDHVRRRDALLRRTGEIFGLIAAGKLKTHIGHRYALDDVAKAHTELAARRTAGKLLLLP